MRQKVQYIILSVLLILSMTACGFKSAAPRYGLVTDSSGVGKTGANADIMNTLLQIGKQKENEARAYEAATDKASDLDAQFDQAAGDGVGLVFAYGDRAGEALLRAQSAHRKVRYALIGDYTGSEKLQLENNAVRCVFRYEDMGFIAGYVAVMSGYRSLAFVAGSYDDMSKRIVSGYVQGAGYAAEKLHLEEHAVSVTGTYAGRAELTPLRMADALAFYNSGAEIVMGVGKNMSAAVSKAAEYAERMFISTDIDLSATDTNCIFSACPVYSGAVNTIVKYYETKDAFLEGKTIECGITEDAVGLAADYTKLRTFTDDNFRTLKSDINEGKAVISAEETTEGNTYVSFRIVNAPSSEESTGSAS
ncbi:MAG: BMP family ABC transporter substrate-binding protein [Lachnospiraceae bacterium]|nr:BMP family ABC transporter substrate-binding protein [Lachnospiraceae bacterium]